MRILKETTYAKLMEKLEEQARQIDALRVDLKESNVKAEDLSEQYDKEMQESALLMETVNNLTDKLDRQKRYQKEQSQKYGKENKELKKQLEETEKKLKNAQSGEAMMAALYNAGVLEFAKFMRTTPFYKSKKKEFAIEKANEMICAKAKKTIDDLKANNPDMQIPQPQPTEE